MKNIPLFDALIEKEQTFVTDEMNFWLNIYCRCKNTHRWDADELEYLYVGNDTYINDNVLGEVVDVLPRLGVKEFTMTQYSTALLREIQVLQEHGWKVAGVVNVLKEKGCRIGWMMKSAGLNEDYDKSKDYDPAILFVHK